MVVRWPSNRRSRGFAARLVAQKHLLEFAAEEAVIWVSCDWYKQTLFSESVTYYMKLFLEFLSSAQKIQEMSERVLIFQT